MSPIEIPTEVVTEAVLAHEIGKSMDGGDGAAAAPAAALTLVPPTIRVIAGTVLIRCAQGVSPTAASGLGVQVIDGRCPLVC